MFFLKIKAMIKETIARKISAVKTKRPVRAGRLIVGEIITIAPSQPAERLTNKSEIIIRKFGSRFFTFSV